MPRETIIADHGDSVTIMLEPGGPIRVPKCVIRYWQAVAKYYGLQNDRGSHHRWGHPRPPANTEVEAAWLELLNTRSEVDDYAASLSG